MHPPALPGEEVSETIRLVRSEAELPEKYSGTIGYAASACQVRKILAVLRNLHRAQ